MHCLFLCIYMPSLYISQLRLRLNFVLCYANSIYSNNFGPLSVSFLTKALFSGSLYSHFSKEWLFDNSLQGVRSVLLWKIRTLDAILINKSKLFGHVFSLFTAVYWQFILLSFLKETIEKYKYPQLVLLKITKNGLLTNRGSLSYSKSNFSEIKARFKYILLVLIPRPRPSIMNY